METKKQRQIEASIIYLAGKRRLHWSLYVEMIACSLPSDV